MRRRLRQLFSNSEGQTMIEYSLLISLIVLVVLTMVNAAQGHFGALVSTAAAAAPR